MQPNIIRIVTGKAFETSLIFRFADHPWYHKETNSEIPEQYIIVYIAPDKVEYFLLNFG